MPTGFFAPRPPVELPVPDMRPEHPARGNYMTPSESRRAIAARCMQPTVCRNTKGISPQRRSFIFSRSCRTHYPLLFVLPFHGRVEVYDVQRYLTEMTEVSTFRLGLPRVSTSKAVSFMKMRRSSRLIEIDRL